MSIRLAVVDGHTLSRHGLARIVADERDMEVVGGAGSLAAGQELVASARPDVVLIAAALPDGDGLALVRELRTSHPGIGVVVMASADTDQPMFRAMESGASAYVAKAAPVADFLAAIRSAAVAPGNFTAAGLVEALGRRSKVDLLLSPREKQVLDLLVDGLSVAAIARSMHLSQSTTKTYTSRLYDKLGAANRAQALVTAIRLGLIRQDQLHRAPHRAISA